MQVMAHSLSPTLALARQITKSASLQTYYTIGLFVDRQRRDDAYRAYAYFRWVDDVLDSAAISGSTRRLFIARQRTLLEACYSGNPPDGLAQQERLLVDLVAADSAPDSGLRAYLVNMMQVMEFDARRRGRLISAAELDAYTQWLAAAVTEAMHFFIGHCCFSPHDRTRYLAVYAAHVTHMLRDARDDQRCGYFNIPREALDARHLSPQDFDAPGYRQWVQQRVNLARRCFASGRNHLARVESLRCRLAGYLYMARFEWLLDAIEKDGYSLRLEYNPHKRLRAGLSMAWLALLSLFNLRPSEARPTASLRTH